MGGCLSSRVKDLFMMEYGGDRQKARNRKANEKLNKKISKQIQKNERKKIRESCGKDSKAPKANNGKYNGTRVKGVKVTRVGGGDSSWLEDEPIGDMECANTCDGMDFGGGCGGCGGCGG